MACHQARLQGQGLVIPQSITVMANLIVKDPPGKEPGGCGLGVRAVSPYSPTTESFTAVIPLTFFLLRDLLTGDLNTTPID